jgi:glutamate/tyrosine decarboxylase-like PLP-dependent enzyme
MADKKGRGYQFSQIPARSKMPGQSTRISPLEMTPDEFRAMGHKLTDEIARFLEGISSQKVNPANTPMEVRQILGTGPLPADGESAGKLIDEASQLVINHSLLNGHPSFFGYITSSAAPIGALADFLAAAVNPNVGSFQLAPVATEIERQSIGWISEMIGYRKGSEGILVTGGNMANFVCMLVARKAVAGWDVSKEGMGGPNARRLRVYTSTETHYWVQKAVEMFGLGTDAIRWIPVDAGLRMDVDRLEKEIVADKAKGDLPLMVVGTAGSVGTGAVDPLERIAEICARHQVWFHADGAYGAIAAVMPDAPADLKRLSLADSVAVDPHKWLYAPLEAGCALVKNRKVLVDAFSFHPTYFKFEDAQGEPPTNFYELGPQNSRGFRALKVWLGLRQAGRSGYERMIADDCALAKEMFDCVREHKELEARTQGLSITTFRYVPPGIDARDPGAAGYLNELNEALLHRIQDSGEAYVSNVVIDGVFLLRACIVNFRTQSKHVRALPELAVRLGRELNAEMPYRLKQAETSHQK